MARYTLIKGEYHIFYPDLPRGGPEPDGDTVTFRPDNPELIRSLPTQGRPPKFNGRKMTSIRLEGIDTLETHFQEMHQELDFAKAARDFMLGQLGFTGIQFWPDQPNRVRAVDNNPQRGFVIANEVESNGRTVAFVFSGDSAKADGSDIFLDVTTMEQSVNVALVNASLTYGAFYTTLPIDLLQRMRELVRAARNAGGGLWATEHLNTQRATEIHDLTKLQTLIMWPKLFRRLADYFASGHVGLSEFDAWIREDVISRDDRLLLPNGEFGNMHDLYSVEDNGTRMQLRFEPEEVVILPDDA